jgi:hypothetical protein
MQKHAKACKKNVISLHFSSLTAHFTNFHNVCISLIIKDIRGGKET